MSVCMEDDIFAKQPYGQLALKKMGKVPADFRLYCAEFLPEGPGPYKAMKVTGAEFRRAQRGPNKDKLCILVPGTQRVAYLDTAAIRRANSKATAKQKSAQPA